MTAFIARQIRRLIALVALAAMLIGAPYALYTLGGPLLPDHMPGLAEIWQRLTERDTFLVIVGFVAWAIFAITVLVEIASRIARRPGWHLPGLHLPQAAAGLLVGMLIAGTIATSATPAIAASMPLLPHPTPVAVATMASPSRAAHHGQAGMTSHLAAPARSAPRAAAAGPTWTVSKGDSLWSIAEKTLGSGRRYHEIEALNQGRIQPDGRTLDSANFLLPGWILQLPAGAHVPAGVGDGPTSGAERAGHGGGSHAQSETVIVDPGDTLSQIALDELGDARLYPEIAAANHIADPDLIHPGQTIHIPVPEAPARIGADDPQQSLGTASESGGDGQPASSHEADGSTEPEHGQAGVGTPGEAAASGVGSPDAQSDVAGGAGVGTAPDSAAATNGGGSQIPDGPSSGGIVPGTTALSSAPDTSASTATVTHSSSGSSQEAQPPTASASEADELLSQRNLLLAGVTTLTAAIAWAGLLLARRRLEQSRRPDQHTLEPPTELEARVEGALRRRAGRSAPERVNRAVRIITPILAQHGDVGVVGVLIGIDSLELLPAKPTPPPAPFMGSGTAWTLQLPEATPGAAIDYERLAALPALATVGTTADGRIAMINLEQIGALHIGGDETRARELANHLIVELSQSPWTDGIHLHLADRPGRLRVLDDDRIQPATDLAGEMRSLAAQAKTIRELLGERSITQARTDITYADAWEPHLLVADGDDLPAGETTMALIDQLQVGPPAAAGLITTGRNPGVVADVRVAADGGALIPTIFPDEVITIAAVTDAELAAIIGLFAACSESTIDNAGDTRDAELSDESECTEGADMIDTTAIDVDLATNIVMLDGNCVTADLTEPDTIAADDGHARNRPVVDVVGARQSISPDEDLDSDLAEWLSPYSRRPKIAILGSATVVGLGPAPQRPQPRQVEMAVYLALHHQGVTVDRFTDDLWPDGTLPTPGGRRVAISRLRSWLGNDPETGEAFVPNRESGYYITDRLLDADLFARLVHRSDRRTHAGDVREALSDLQRALALVRGPILPEAGGHDYAWLAAADRLEDRTLPVAVVDAAHVATDLALAMGDSDAAESAAMVGRSVQPYSLIPLCDLIRVAQCCGDGETAATWARATLEAADADVPAELPEHVREHVAAALAGSGRDRLTTGARQ